MGPFGLLTVVVLLVAAGVASARLKSRYLRPSRERFCFEPREVAEGPLVSVVIPARNEVDNLPGLLDGVLSQGYGSLEVIVVDDSSSDGTAEVARGRARRDSRVRLVEAEPLPSGWTGKNHTLAEGVKGASGEFLLFLVCDVRLRDENVVGGLVDHARREGLDLYSVIPRQELGGVGEKFFGPAVYTIMGLTYLPIKEVNDPGREKAAAVGQCMFFKRSAYEAMGGHEAVKSHIAEDIEMARLLKSSGRRIGLSYSTGDISVRMYTSTREIWRGWSKHLYRSAAGGPGAFLWIEAGFLLAFVVPPVLAVISLLALLGEPGFYSGAALFLAASTELHAQVARARRYRSMGWPMRWEPAFPAAMLFALALLASSAVKHRLPRGLAWKGRRYSAGRLFR